MTWPMLDELQNGWQFDKTVGSPVHGYVFATNGKSVVNGQQRALVRAHPVPITEPAPTFHFEPPAPKPTDRAEFPAKTFNELARKRFELRLMADIRFDMAVCDIEGWSKDEYLKELLELIKTLTTK